MKGYLLAEQAFVAGEEIFIESRSAEHQYAVVFEDDTETAYFYAMAIDRKSGSQQVLDAVHVYEADGIEPANRTGVLSILWSADWLKCGLLINKYCYAVFDFANQGGYCRSEFPPPNDIWTKGNRRLTDKMVTAFFT